MSETDRQHFLRIAQGEMELNHEAVAAGAKHSPGENILLGFELGAFATLFGGDLTRPEEISPASLWRARTKSLPAPR